MSSPSLERNSACSNLVSQPTSQLTLRGSSRGAARLAPAARSRRIRLMRQRAATLALPSPEVQICGPWAMLQPPKQASPILMCNQLHRSVTAALTGWLSWLEHCPTHQKFAGLIPDQGTYLVCGFHPRLGSIWRQLIDVEANSRR